MSNKKIIYSAGSVSPIHLLQWVAMGFCVAGCILAVKLARAPANPLVNTTTHYIWAAGLLVVAVVSPVVVWRYGRKVASRIALSDDGRTAFIKDANLLGSAPVSWPVESLNVVEYAPGDPSGEESVAPPRLTLAAREGTHVRQYVVAVKGRRQADDLCAALHPRGA